MEVSFSKTSSDLFSVNVTQTASSVYRSKTGPAFRLFCGMLDGLVFLPLLDVMVGFDFPEGIVPAGRREHCRYCSTYFNVKHSVHVHVHCTHETAEYNDDVFQRRCGTYTDRQTDRGTENYSEACNGRYKALLGQRHPSIWTARKILQADRCVALSVLLCDSTYKNPSSPYPAVPA